MQLEEGKKYMSQKKYDVAIYGATMLLYGMNDYEKNLIFKPLKKILKKFHIVKEV